MATKSVLIVGGGICGLMAATVLQRAGLQVTVLDKGRAIGGRLASRRLRAQDQVGCCDFGAQYFKAVHPLFQSWVNEWQQQGVVQVWSEQGLPKLDGGSHSEGVSLFRGEPSNRSLAQYLAESLTVVNQERMTHCHWDSQRWTVKTESGQQYGADLLVLTPPIPQILDLLTASAIALPEDIQSALQSVTYDPCFSLSLLLAEPSLIPPPGGLWLWGEPLVWIACSQQKGISPDGYAVTVQAGPEFSRSHLDTDRQQVAELMITAAQSWLGSEILDQHLHLWRYSHVVKPYGAPFVAGKFPGPMYLGGDGFPGGNVEGAALSGLAIAEQILNDVESLAN